jgi:hypothetical protein
VLDGPVSLGLAVGGGLKQAAGADVVLAEQVGHEAPLRPPLPDQLLSRTGEGRAGTGALGRISASHSSHPLVESKPASRR